MRNTILDRDAAKKTIITLVDSFHGRTIATLTATGQTEYQQGFDPLPSGFAYCTANDVNMLRELMSEQVAAIMLEPVLGEGGIVPLSQEFMHTARQLCSENNALLILDEVQTGIGRTGKLFAFEHYEDVVPDVLTLAKSLGGGMAIGAFIVKNEHSHVLQPGTHGSTFGGNPLACAAAVAVLQAIEEESLLQNATASGRYLFDALTDMGQKHDVITKVRGLGLMLGVELTAPGAAVVDQCRAHRLLINCTHRHVLRLMPALDVTHKEIDRAVATLDQVLTRMAPQWSVK